MMDLQKRLDLEEIYRTYMEMKPQKNAAEVEILFELGIRGRAKPVPVPQPVQTYKTKNRLFK